MRKVGDWPAAFMGLFSSKTVKTPKQRHSVHFNLSFSTEDSIERIGKAAGRWRRAAKARNGKLAARSGTSPRRRAGYPCRYTGRWHKIGIKRGEVHGIRARQGEKRRKRTCEPAERFRVSISEWPKSILGRAEPGRGTRACRLPPRVSSW